MKEKKLKSIDLVSGIGGFRLAMENNNIQCLAYSEINKKAINVYQKNFPNDNCFNLGDIEKLDFNYIRSSYRDIDLITAGVPCQPWSVGGKNLGFKDPRGLIWFNTIRFLEATQSKAFIFENVSGLLNQKHKNSFSYICKLIQEAGYVIDYDIFNALEYGLNQDRERIFIVGLHKSLNLQPSLVIANIKKYRKYKQVNPTKPYTLCDLRGGDYTIHSWELANTSILEKEICNWLLKNRRKKQYGNKDGNPIKASIIRKKLNKNKKEFYKAIKNLINLKVLEIVHGTYIDFKNRKLYLGINGVHRVYYKNASVYPTLVSTGNHDYIIDETIYSKDQIYEKLRMNQYRELSKEDYKKIQGFPHHFISDENPKEAKKQYGNSIPIPLVNLIIKETKNQLLKHGNIGFFCMLCYYLY